MPRSNCGLDLEIGPWADQYLIVIDNTCLYCHCGLEISYRGFVALWQDFYVIFFFPKWKLFLGH